MQACRRAGSKSGFELFGGSSDMESLVCLQSDLFVSINGRAGIDTDHIYSEFLLSPHAMFLEGSIRVTLHS